MQYRLVEHQQISVNVHAYIGKHPSLTVLCKETVYPHLYLYLLFISKI